MPAPITAIVLLAAALAVPATDRSGAIVMPEDRTVEVAAGDQVELALVDLVTGVNTPVFMTGAVTVTDGPCAAQPGSAWDSLIIAVPRDAEGVCEVDYSPTDPTTGASASGVITVEVLAAAEEETAAEADDDASSEPAEAYKGGDDTAEPQGATSQAGADRPTTTDDEVLSVTVTIRRSEAPLVGGAVAVLLVAALVTARVRRRRRDQQLLAAATPAASPAPTATPTPETEERAW